MSNRNSAQGGLTRRGFLRTTGAAAALGAMSGLAGCSSASESSQLAEAGSEEQVFAASAALTVLPSATSIFMYVTASS